jgi:hypothetical protein
MTRSQAEAAAQALLDIFCNFGFARTIMSYNGNNFVNKIFDVIHKTSGMDTLPVSKYHPHANGLVEKMVGTMSNVLRKLIS